MSNCPTCGKTPGQASSCGCGWGVDHEPPRKQHDAFDPTAVARARRRFAQSVERDIAQGTDETMARIRRYIEER